METFDIKEAGSELERALKGELSSDNVVRLTIDVQIPELLSGDKKGFCDSIIQICTYLNRHIVGLNIDIELLRAEQYTDEIKLGIDIKAYHPDNQLVTTFVNLRQSELGDLLKNLPYSTKFSHDNSRLHFSSFMRFRYSRQREDTANLMRNKKVLLVEEYELSALTLITFLEELGCHVTKASGSVCATEEMKIEQYDIVLMNIHAPEIRCVDTIRKIRSYDQLTPIIGLTSPWSKDHTLDAYAAGMNDVLSKPISSGELLKMLRKYV